MKSVFILLTMVGGFLIGNSLKLDFSSSLWGNVGIVILATASYMFGFFTGENNNAK